MKKTFCYFIQSGEMAYLQQSFCYPWIIPLQKSHHLRTEEGLGRALNEDSSNKTNRKGIGRRTYNHREHYQPVWTCTNPPKCAADQKRRMGTRCMTFQHRIKPSCQWHRLRKCLQKCCQPTRGCASSLLAMQTAPYKDDRSMLCVLI